MKILYISQYFYPEMGAAAARVYEMSKHWVQMGHEVSVLTSFPNYPDGVISPDYRRQMKKLIIRENVSGIDVMRTIGFPTHLRSSLRRSLNYSSFFISSVISSNFLKNYDVAIGTSPSLLVGLAGLMVARIKKAYFIFEVRDLWPEAIMALGKGSSNSISYRVFDRIASYLYEKSDLIVAVTDSFKEELVSTRGLNPEKIRVVENAVDTDFFQPEAPEPALIDSPELRNKFIVSYIGTIGYTHGTEVVLKSATEIRTRFPDIVFLLIGGGSEKERLEKIKEEQHLENVVFLDHQPRELIPGYINSSEISLVLSSKEPLFEKTIFAKAFEPMACGKPIIVGAEGETRALIVEKAKAGIGFEPESPGGLIESIAALYDKPELRKKLGENGRTYVTNEFSRALKADQYSEIMEALIDGE